MGPVPELVVPAVWSLVVPAWAAMRSTAAGPVVPELVPLVAPAVGSLLTEPVPAKLGPAAVPEAPLL